MFYARYNRYGSPTSEGFANTNQVYAFETRKARDAYVLACENTNLSVIALSVRDAHHIAGAPDWNGERLYLTPQEFILY